VVARVGGQLVHYRRNDAPGFQWHPPVAIGNQLVGGNPCLITGLDFRSEMCSPRILRNAS